MKRSLVPLTLVLVAFATLIGISQIMAGQPNRTLVGPDFGKDPPPRKVVSLLRDLLA